MAKFVNQCTNMLCKIGCVIGFFHPPEITCQLKEVIPVSRFANQY